MSFAKILNSVTNISNDDEVNNKNYIESLNYIDNLYKITTKLSKIIPITEVTFLPSFKGKTIKSLLNEREEKENIEEETMCFIKTRSKKFLEDETRKKIETEFKDICKKILIIEENVIFVLKEGSEK